MYFCILKNLMAQLRALCVRPAIPPYHIPYSDQENEDIDNEELERFMAEELDEDTADKEALTILSTKKMPTEHSRWSLSNCQYFCPVQLFNGTMEYGKPQFVCG